MAREFRVGLRTVQRWLARAGDQSLDAVDWSSRPSRPHRVERTDPGLEDLILELRRELRETSILGEYGAVAIRRALVEAGQPGPLPSVRTIGRILDRRGALDRRGRVRRPPPPVGWYLPDVAARAVELDSFDVIEGLRLRGGRNLDVLTAISLHGALPAAWVEPGVSSRTTVRALADHWRAVGLPGYAQFDNDGRFYGSHANPDVFGPVVRLCLGLGVVPVFAPPHETGFQAAVESFNGRWQAKVWNRFWSDDLGELATRSERYVAALRRRHAVRIESAPARRPIPAGWQPDLRAVPRGRLVFLRRTSSTGTASVFGRTYAVAEHWPFRLVRAEIDTGAGVLRFYALRRREPTDQPLLREVPYLPVPHPGSRLPGPGTLGFADPED